MAKQWSLMHYFNIQYTPLEHNLFHHLLLLCNIYEETLDKKIAECSDQTAEKPKAELNFW